LESKATKATKGISSEFSNKINQKVVSFSDEDMEKILETMKKDKTPSSKKMHNWRAFAEQQMQGAHAHKSPNKR